MQKAVKMINYGIKSMEKDKIKSESVPHSSTTIDTLNQICKSAIDQKALDLRVLDLKGVSDIADHFIILSATSERHGKGIVDKIIQNLKSSGEAPLCIDGYDKAEWILVDYGSIILHVFFEPKRQYYKFDELWENAKEVTLSPELDSQVKRFKTGIVY